MALLSPPPGAENTGGDGNSPDTTLLCLALTHPRRALLHLRPPGHYCPVAGRLGTQAGAAGEAVGKGTVLWFPLQRVVETILLVAFVFLLFKPILCLWFSATEGKHRERGVETERKRQEQ